MKIEVSRVDILGEYRKERHATIKGTQFEMRAFSLEVGSLVVAVLDPEPDEEAEIRDEAAYVLYDSDPRVSGPDDRKAFDQAIKTARGLSASEAAAIVRQGEIPVVNVEDLPGGGVGFFGIEISVEDFLKSNPEIPTMGQWQRDTIEDAVAAQEAGHRVYVGPLRSRPFPVPSPEVFADSCDELASRARSLGRLSEAQRLEDMARHARAGKGENKPTEEEFTSEAAKNVDPAVRLNDATLDPSVDLSTAKITPIKPTEADLASMEDTPEEASSRFAVHPDSFGGTDDPSPEAQRFASSLRSPEEVEGLYGIRTAQGDLPLSPDETLDETSGKDAPRRKA